MPIMTELVISVFGGIITALVLEMMGRGGGSRSEVGRSSVSAGGHGSSGDSMLGGVIRVVLAVAGGLAIAMLGGRMLIQAGIMPKGQGGRLVLLVVGTVVVWLLLAVAKRR